MKCLVTGGCGFIGSHVVDLLIDRGYNVLVIDNLSTSKKIALNRIETITKKKLKHYNCDITKKSDLEDIFKKIKIDNVIHLAGFKSVSESMIDPIKYYKNNILGSVNLIEMMCKYQISKIIFSSSATVYGHPRKLPIDESHNLNPVNVYGKSKLTVENMIKDLVESDSIKSGICLRYFNPVGSYKKGLLGEDPSKVSDNLIPQILETIFNDSKVLNIYGNNLTTYDGSAVRDFIHISDLIDGHVSSLNFQRDNKGFYEFNLGTGKGVSVFQILNTFQNIISKPIKYNIKSQRPGEIPSYYCDPAKAKKYLKWTSKCDIHSMCEDALLWYKKINNY